MLYLETPFGFVPWSGENINDVRHPKSIESVWSDEELAAIGLYKPVASDPVPDGKIIASTIAERVGDTVKFVNILIDDPNYTNQNIINAPKLGFGGPTGEEIFHGNQ